MNILEIPYNADDLTGHWFFSKVDKLVASGNRALNLFVFEHVYVCYMVKVFFLSVGVLHPKVPRSALERCCTIQGIQPMKYIMLSA